MDAKQIILCPGQGAQHVGMGKTLAESSPAAKAIFDQAAEVLGFDLAELCFNGPEEKLNQTDMSQPAIFVASVASYHAAQSEGKIQGVSTAFAGLSLGEYTALHLAGSFDFATGLKLVALRGKAMQQAASNLPGGMVAIMGGEDAQVEALCSESAQGEVLVPANYNAPGQIVASGHTSACDRLAIAASAAGLRAVPLVVAGAFHSPLMLAAAEALKQALDESAFAKPAAVVFSNVTASPHLEVESIKSLLVDQLVKPVRWTQTMSQLANVAGLKFVELAPGRVLAGLLKKQNRRAELVSLGA